MKTILLCGYRTSDYQEDPLGLACDAGGRTLIDRRIDDLVAMGFEVLCVLAGTGADEQLRGCRNIARTQLIFDDTPSRQGLISNIKAGLIAAPDEPCFALPVEIPCAEPEVWSALRNAGAQGGFGNPASLLQAVNRQGAPWQFGFPLFITRTGNRQIRDLAGLTSLLDARLNYLHLTVEPEAGLASEPKAA